MIEDLPNLLQEVRDCTICSAELPLGPRPVLRAERTARLMIVGQAPGTKVHQTGIPWNDASGRRLREWLQLSSQDFYDAATIAIVPIGLCYPGKNVRGGDLAPRPECAPQWHPQLRQLLGNIQLTLLVGSYAQAFYLKNSCKPTLTETVRCYQQYLPEFWPLPHPSWRNTAWLSRNPWFERKVLPRLRERIAELGHADILTS